MAAARGALSARFRKRFPRGPAIRAELELDTAGVTVLFGPSGAGKTTVLRCLAGLEHPEEGFIHCGDEIWYDAGLGIALPPQKRRAGYLSQGCAVFPHLTARQNIEYGIADLGKTERVLRTAAMIRLLQLAGLENRRPGQLSGGELQRVALARALAPQPRLLLLDEPLSALDAPARGRLQGELRRLLSQAGIPALLVTHDRTEAIALGDRVAVMAAGSIRQTGPVQEVFNRPADLAVAESVGMETVVPARIVAAGNGLLTLAAGAARISALDPGDIDGNDVFLCIRAEEVMLEKGPASQGSARNHLPGRITALAPEGALVRVFLDCGFPLVALITRQSREDLSLAPHDTVYAVVKATSVHLIPHFLRGPSSAQLSDKIG
jgi:molybdate transport system ATP-binding protein